MALAHGRLPDLARLFFLDPRHSSVPLRLHINTAAIFWSRSCVSTMTLLAVGGSRIHRADRATVQIPKQPFTMIRSFNICRSTFSHRLQQCRIGRSFSDASKETPLDASKLSRQLTELSEEGLGFEGFVQHLSAAGREQVHQAMLAARAASTSLNVPEPTRKDLQAVALATCIPFIAFGIMDNALLIIAGDAIDTSFGVLLGISTMCAAALGNIISDVAGVMFGTVVEDWLAKHVKLPAPNLTTAQRQLRSVRFANQFGCALGMTIGCLIGM